MNEVKSIFKSKTFWANAASLATMGAQWASGHQFIAPDTQVAAMGVLNLFLRYVTKVPVSVTGK